MVDLLKIKENKQIIAVVGKTASGKDTFVSALVEAFRSTPIAVKKVVSYTTRPQRTGEKEGIDYFFIDEKKYLKKEKNDFFFEKTKYEVTVDNGKETWYYGIGRDSFSKDYINILIVNPLGLEQLKKSPIGKRIVPIYVTCSKRERIKRYLSRDENASKIALKERLVRDEVDFKDFKKNLRLNYKKYYCLKSKNGDISKLFDLKRGGINI